MPESSHISIKRADSAGGLRQENPPVLSVLDIELTERCNNNCVHCAICQSGTSAEAQRRELSAGEIKDLLSQSASLGALSVRFTGGEPLLRDDFEEIYMSARKLGLRVLLFTNARLITPHIARLFSRIPLLGKIEVTVYGMHEKSYEACSREKGSYAEFRRGIELLLQYNIPFVVKGLMLPSTANEIAEFEAWAGTIPWMEEKPAIATILYLRDRRDSHERNDLIKKLRPSPETHLSILQRRACYRKETVGFCGRYGEPPGTLLFSCGAGRRPCVDPYGYLQLCLSLRHPDTVYSLKQGSLQDAIKVFIPKMREMRATNRDYIERCAVCFLKNLCDQCPAKSWTEHGTLDTPVEYFCNITHAIAEDIGLLQGSEKGWQIKNWKDRLAKAASKLL